jgi:hypothetical protein
MRQKAQTSSVNKAPHSPAEADRALRLRQMNWTLPNLEVIYQP